MDDPSREPEEQYRVKPTQTPCQEAGYAVGDIFLVTCDGPCPIVAKLAHDDASNCPLFYPILDFSLEGAYEIVEDPENCRFCAPLRDVIKIPIK